MPNVVRALLVALAVMLGVPVAVLLRIAILGELVGFGGQGPQPITLVALAVGFVASLGLPALVGRWLFPEHGGRVFIGVFVCGLLVTEAVLGLLVLI